MLTKCQLDNREHTLMKFCLNVINFRSRKCVWKCCRMWTLLSRPQCDSQWHGCWWSDDERSQDIALILMDFPDFCTERCNDAIMSAMASQITSLTIVYSTVYSGADQIKHQSSASLAFVRGIHRWPVNSPHKWPVTPKKFPLDDVIMCYSIYTAHSPNIKRE